MIENYVHHCSKCGRVWESSVFYEACYLCEVDTDVESDILEEKKDDRSSKVH